MYDGFDVHVIQYPWMLERNRTTLDSVRHFFNRPLMIVEHLTCEYIVDRTANIVHKKVPGITGDMVVLFLGPVIESSSKINSVSPELL